MIMTGLLIILWNLEKCSARSDNVAFQYNVICIYIGISSVVILAPNISMYIVVYQYYSIGGVSLSVSVLSSQIL